MTTSKLLGCLFLVAGLFVLTQSPGWQIPSVALSASLGFVGLVLVSRLRPRSSPEYRERARRTYLEARMAAK